jgi:hypothetical protein
MGASGGAMTRTRKLGIASTSPRAGLDEYLHGAASILLKNSTVLPSLDRSGVTERKIRLALLKLGALSRRRYRDSFNEGSRVELRLLLENARRTAGGLSHALADERFVRALQLAQTKEAIRYQIQDFEKNRSIVIDQIRGLVPIIGHVLEVMRLSGKGGRSGPFHTVQLPAKVLLSIYGRKIFIGLGITRRAPSARNETFVEFLSCVWGLAISPSEAEGDWSTPIKIAAAQRKTGAGAVPHTLARLEASDFVRDLLRNLGSDKRALLASIRIS